MHQVFLVLVGLIGLAASQRVCDQYGSTSTDRYVIMNNRWGSQQEQCIELNGNNGFTIVSQQGSTATNGAPLSYPAVYFGCHYSNCSPGTNLPIQLGQIRSATSSITYRFADGVFDAAYDIWLDPNPNTGSVNAQEIMIWFNRQGPIQPIGQPNGSVNIAGVEWTVWQGSNGQNQVISYVAPNPVNSLNFSVLDFLNDGKARGLYNDSWYLTSIQAGFEPWSGGVGLAVSGFSAQVN